jgi:uncharacterized protein
MHKASRDFQVFVKPVSSLCNLGCSYCYYLEKHHLYPDQRPLRMPEGLLEKYIIQHISASPEPVIRFSWHGGEPTLPGCEYFRKIVEFQKKHLPRDRTLANGIQTNGTLIDDEWCRLFSEEGFTVGLSLDGPQEMHDRYRLTKDRGPTFEQVMRSWKLLQRHRIFTEILCVINDFNVMYPLQLYRFFKDLGASYITFLPLVERLSPDTREVSERSVPAHAWGGFLSVIFDEWADHDIGRVKVQIFEEAARTAFDQEHSLCIFRPVCGDIPVIEHNGDFYSCDHFVDKEHRLGNITKTPLVEMLESPEQRAFGQKKLDALPLYCQECEVRDMCHGGCPKNRFLKTPDGTEGLNYLCAGYRLFFNHCRPFVDKVAAEWKKIQD